MKQAKNNEIDLLLRKLARHELTDSARGTRVANAAEENEAGKHLDTDELNAYAENALPSTARVFYTEHLADCERCRKLVAELSVASGASVRHATVEIRAPSGFRKYLSLFFSPAVLRYVVPAFAVIAVAAVALVILRQKPSADFVAQNQSSTSSSVTREEQETKASALKDASLKKAPAAAVESTANSKASNPPPEQARPSTKVSEKATADDLRRESKKAPIDESSSVVAAEQPAAAPPQEPTVSAKPQAANEVQAEREVDKQKKLEAADQAGGNKEEDRGRKLDSVAASRTSPRKTQGLFGRVAGNVQGPVSKDAPATAATEKSAKNEGEVRNVVGHRFRKQGSVWVDSAYDSSRQTVNLSRGSEQYRALVADEPAIRTIAEQLDGEVIVVWKGRVYRIR
jgi:hypothetical protein